MLERWWQSIQEIKYLLILCLLFIALVMLLFTPVAYSMFVPLFCVRIIPIQTALNVKLVEPRFSFVFEWFPHILVPNRGEENHDCRIVLLDASNA